MVWRKLVQQPLEPGQRPALHAVHLAVPVRKFAVEVSRAVTEAGQAHRVEIDQVECSRAVRPCPRTSAGCGRGRRRSAAPSARTPSPSTPIHHQERRCRAPRRCRLEPQRARHPDRGGCQCPQDVELPLEVVGLEQPGAAGATGPRRPGVAAPSCASPASAPSSRPRSRSPRDRDRRSDVLADLGAKPRGEPTHSLAARRRHHV